MSDKSLTLDAPETKAYSNTTERVILNPAQVLFVRSAFQRMKDRQKDKIRAHIGRCTMSVYGTQAECKAARDALERLLDDEA